MNRSRLAASIRAKLLWNGMCGMVAIFRPSESPTHLTPLLSIRLEPQGPPFFVCSKQFLLCDRIRQVFCSLPVHPLIDALFNRLIAYVTSNSRVEVWKFDFFFFFFLHFLSPPSSAAPSAVFRPCRGATPHISPHHQSGRSSSS